MKKSSRQGVRLLLLTGIILGCAGVQALAAHLIPPSSYGDRPVQGINLQPPQDATGKLIHLLRLDRDNHYKVNLITRSIVLSSTGVMAIWFVVGGVPRRRRRSSLLQLPAASERVSVLDTPRLHARPSDIFHRAFTETGTTPRVSVQLTPNMTSSATVLELMNEPALMPELVESETPIHAAVDAVVERAIASDDALMAEVQQYARELLSSVPRRAPAPRLPAEDLSIEVAAPVVDPEPPVVESLPVTLREIETVEIPAPVQFAPAAPIAAAAPPPLDEEDILGLAELVRPVPAVQPPSPFNELFEAVTTVQNASASAVDPYELIMGEFAPLPEELPEPPLDPAVIAQLLAPPASSEVAPLLDQRVIVIGESDAVIEVEKRILISASARVIGFRRFGDAVRFADEKDFDLLLINGMTEDGWSAPGIHDWLAENRPGWERRSAFALSAPDPASDEFAARTGAWCIVHPFGPKELVSFLCAVLAPPDDIAQAN